MTTAYQRARNLAAQHRYRERTRQEPRPLSMSPAAIAMRARRRGIVLPRRRRKGERADA